MAEKTTVEWVCVRYPERVKALFEALDLDRAGLDEVKAAVAKGDFVAASKVLLDYYSACESGKWLHWADSPKPGDARDEKADAILNDTFTFYTQTDRVPRESEGGLVWSYRGPQDDAEWMWALNRHLHIAALLAAYWNTGNPDYARVIDWHLRDWIAASLPYPGRRSEGIWRGLESSFRAKVWAKVFFGMQQNDLLAPATRLLMLTSLPEHAHYLRHFHAKGNWATMELSALGMIGAAWPEYKESSGWLDYASDTLTRELAAQVYPDGVQTELTSDYHLVALRNFEQLAEICRSAGMPLPEAYAADLEKMWNYLACIMGPDGQGVANNDSNHSYIRNQVQRAAETYGRPDWTYIASNGAKGKKPEYGPSVMFPWAGQLVIRSGWDAAAVWAFFDVGPWGAGHQHNDKLHLSVSAYGRDLLVDSGRFVYLGENVRFQGQYGVLSRAHNVLMLDGKGQRGGVRRAQKPIAVDDYLISPEMNFARGSCDFFDGIAGKAVHTRAVVYLQDKLIVVADRIETDRPRKLEALWHWHPSCTVKAEEGTVVSTNADVGNLRIVPVAGIDWKTEILKGQETPDLQGWYAHEYNKWEPNPTAVLTANISESTAFAWLLVPAHGEVEVVRGDIVESTAEVIRIRIDRVSKQTLIVNLPWRNGIPLIEVAPRK